MFNILSEKTFINIAKYWRYDEYKLCKEKWKNVQHFIVATPDTNYTSIACKECGIYQKDKEYIDDDFDRCGTCNISHIEITSILNKGIYHICDGCGTIWKDNIYIYKIEGICCVCDTYIMPYLSNPINHDYVIRYIDPKWHAFIIN